ncbi:MAG TPA: ABC transporter permease [Acidobacteriota bacterium]
MNEIRHALRRLTARPGFTVVCILTLGLGIGVNVAIFALVYGVIMRPLPYPQPERLVSISHQAPALHLDDMEISAPLYLRYREQAGSFVDIAMIADGRISLTGGAGEPQRLRYGLITPSTFRVFGLAPLVGRPFGPRDSKPGAAPVVLISERLWRGRFGAAPAILGRSLEVDGTPREVVGVMPAAFEIPDPEADLWMPFIYDREQHPLGRFEGACIARLKPEATVATARADLKRFTDGIVEQFPEERAAPVLRSAGFQPIVRPLLDEIIGEVRQALLVLLGGVGFVLLMACSNVANLFLVRAERRQRELAVRSALGASRAQLLAGFMIEGLLLALAAGAASVLLARLGIGTLIPLAPEGIPRLHSVELGAPVLIFALALALLSALLFAFLPLLSFAKTDLMSALRESGWGLSGSARTRLRRYLVVAQFALSMVLLIGAGLMVRSFRELSRVDPGFDPQRALSLRLSLPAGRYAGPAEIAAFVDRVVEQVEALPGVEAAGAVSLIPLGGSASGAGHALEDFPIGEDQVPPVFFDYEASPGYLRAMGLKLIAGRWFEPRDHQRPGEVAVISASLAKRFWPDASPLGRRLQPGRPESDQWYTIVGVVGDVHHFGLQEEPSDSVYYPMVRREQDGGIGGNLTLVLRTQVAPETLSQAARAALWKLDPNIPIDHVMTLERLVAEAGAPMAFSMLLLLIAAALALILGGIGLYGVISFVVGQRTQEIGVRMALGAQPQRVHRMILWDGLKVAWPGIAIGLAASLALTRIMKSLLYGVSPLDLWTFALVPLVLTALALGASLLPARRAARVDPAIALRAE